MFLSTTKLIIISAGENAVQMIDCSITNNYISKTKKIWDEASAANGLISWRVCSVQLVRWQYLKLEIIQCSGTEYEQVAIKIDLFIWLGYTQHVVSHGKD